MRGVGSARWHSFRDPQVWPALEGALPPSIASTSGCRTQSCRRMPMDANTAILFSSRVAWMRHRLHLWHCSIRTPHADGPPSKVHLCIAVFGLVWGSTADRSRMMIHQTGNTSYLQFAITIFSIIQFLHSCRFKLTSSPIHQFNCHTIADDLLYCNLFHPLFPRFPKIATLAVGVRL